MKIVISYQMQKTAMFYLQNCDLWNFFKKYQNFEFKKKRNSNSMHRTKKSHEKNPSLRITFYIYVPNFRALGPIILF